MLAQATIAALLGLAAASPLAANVPTPGDPADNVSYGPTDDMKAGVMCDVAQFRNTKSMSFTNTVQNDGPVPYLKGLSGQVDQPAGPGNCARVSCAWDLGVYFCNDSPHSVQVDWNTVADYVNDVGMVCGGGVFQPDPFGGASEYFDFRNTKDTNGQKFFSDGDTNWNVIVQGDKC